MLLRRSTAFFTLVAVMAVGYTLYRFVFASPASAPESFIAARTQSAVIARTIVETAEGITADLELINDLERQGEYSDALVMTSELAKRNVDMREYAGALSAELQRMTLVISQIGSEEAQRAAVEAVRYRLALISHLFTYTDHVMELVEVLRGRFSGAKGSQDVGAVIEEINRDVAEINTLDMQATEAIERFDKLMR